MPPKKIVTRQRTKNEAAVALGRLGGLAKSGHRINAEAVRYIRKSNKSARELAEEFGLHVSSVYHIKSRHTWAWVS